MHFFPLLTILSASLSSSPGLPPVLKRGHRPLAAPSHSVAQQATHFLSFHPLSRLTSLSDFSFPEPAQWNAGGKTSLPSSSKYFWPENSTRLPKTVVYLPFLPLTLVWFGHLFTHSTPLFSTLFFLQLLGTGNRTRTNRAFSLYAAPTPRRGQARKTGMIKGALKWRRTYSW